MKWTSPLSLGTYSNKNKQAFTLSWEKWIEPHSANYRLFLVRAKHATWGEMRFTVMVTKAAYLDARSAIAILEGDALRDIQFQLDYLTTADGRDRLMPQMKEGWCVI